MRFPVVQAFGVVTFLHMGHSNRYHSILTVFHCYFNLHFPDGTWCAASFNLFIFHLNINFGKLFLGIMDCFLDQVVCFLMVEFFAYFGNCPLSHTSFAHNFSQSVVCLLILLTISLVEQKHLILMRFSLLISIFFLYCAFTKLKII